MIGFREYYWLSGKTHSREEKLGRFPFDFDQRFWRGVNTAELAGKYALIVIFVCLCVGMWGILAGVYILAVKEWGPGGGTLVISGWGCAAGTLEPSAYTRASSAEFCYPILEFLKSLLS